MSGVRWLASSFNQRVKGGGVIQKKKMFCVFSTMGAAKMTPTLAVNPPEWKLIVRFLWLTSHLNGTEGQPRDNQGTSNLDLEDLRSYVRGFS